ncbi:MAG: hypothetical protein C0184_00840 [Chloroflexus aggregans]|uniref:Uncharacterized protein n=2 Tax=Chloroflexus TaxID=1107 RepID=A0A2J6XFD9_9CHLR|nr:MAG: hypothetical protein C0184_00840 [Chloroflexus aggregans]
MVRNAARLYRYMMVEIGDSFRLHDVLHAGETFIFSRHDLPYLYHDRAALILQVHTNTVRLCVAI